MRKATLLISRNMLDNIILSPLYVSIRIANTGVVAKVRIFFGNMPAVGEYSAVEGSRLSRRSFFPKSRFFREQQRVDYYLTKQFPLVHL